ncbi:hypothetical protein [Streptomyces sp. NPDC001123]
MPWLPINGSICAEVLAVPGRLATEQVDRRELVSEASVSDPVKAGTALTSAFMRSLPKPERLPLFAPALGCDFNRGWIPVERRGRLLLRKRRSTPVWRTVISPV